MIQNLSVTDVIKRLWQKQAIDITVNKPFVDDPGVANVALLNTSLV